MKDWCTAFEGWSFQLARISWELFGTLTFVGYVPAPRIAYGLAWRLFRQLSTDVRQPYSRLLIVLREERGELFGRSHLHFLLGDTSSRNLITTAHQLQYWWKGSTRMSRAQVRPYDSCRAGAAYVSKCLDGSETIRAGANQYEVEKFNLANQVTCSDSVFRVIGGLNRLEQRLLARTRERNGRVMNPVPE